MKNNNIEKAILKYTLFPNYYTSDKYTYESFLCECLNKSGKVGKFSLVEDQSNGEPDVVGTDNKGNKIKIDFKLMISQDMKKFQNETSTKVKEIDKGVRIFGYKSHKKEQAKREVVSLWNACRNMNEEQLQNLRIKKTKIANTVKEKAEKTVAEEVVHFFDEVLNVKKNILLFIPVYFSIVDESLSTESQYNTISEEIYNTISYIYNFRNKIKNENGEPFRTFIIYTVKIANTEECNFIIAEFKSEKLKFIDKVEMYSLETIKKTKELNEIY